MGALTAEAHSTRLGDYLPVEGLARRYHVGEDTLRAVRDAYPDRFTVGAHYRTRSPYTGAGHDPPVPYSIVVPTKGAPAETLAAMVATMPEAFKPAEPKPRGKQPDPEAPAETPACPEDGDRPTVTALRQAAVTSGADCGTPLAAVSDHVLLTPAPEPRESAQADPARPGVGAGRSPRSVGPGTPAADARRAWIDGQVDRATARVRRAPGAGDA